MAPSPAGMKVVGPGPDQWVRNSVDNAGDEEHNATERGTDAEYLVVKHHRDDTCRTKHGLFERSTGEHEFGFERNNAALLSFRGHCCSVN